MRALLLIPLIACTTQGPDGRRGPGGGDPGTTEPTEPTTTVPAPDPWVEQGDGEFEHIPCDPGQDTPLFYGAQGGFHVNVSLQPWHLGDIVWLGADVYRASNGEHLGGADLAAYQLADFDDARQTGWYAGLQARMSVEIGCALDGVEIEVCGYAEDAFDHARTAESCMPLVARMVERPAVCDGL